MAERAPIQIINIPPQQIFCTYCGSAVHAEFYFCTVCSAPYQQPEAVLPAVRPVMVTEAQKIALEAPHVMPLFWVYFAVVIGASVIAGSAFGKGRPDLQLMFETGAIALTTAFFAAYHWRTLVDQLKVPGFNSKYAWIAMGLLLVSLGANYAWHKGITYLLPESKSSTPLLRELPLSWVALVAIFCIFPAITEEIAFRGLVQHWLSSAIKPFRALLIASALFMALHFSVVSAPYLFAVGMLLGWAKQKTGSLYPSIVIHFLHNFLVISFFHV
jgi:membrane protease YdiL (CAAX protease family)